MPWRQIFLVPARPPDSAWQEGGLVRNKVIEGGSQMAKKQSQDQLVAFEELLVSNTIQIDAVTQLLIEKGFFTKDEFFDMLQQVQLEYKRKS